MSEFIHVFGNKVIICVSNQTIKPVNDTDFQQ